MGLIKEFKEFAMKGNVMDMAVGVVLGGAFSKIVGSMVKDIIMPLVGLASGGDQFAGRVYKLGVGEKTAAIGYGDFLQTVVDFLIVAFCIFMAIKAMNRATELAGMGPEEKDNTPAPPPEDVQLLREIRDSLTKK